MSTDSELIRSSAVTPSDFGELFDRHAAAVHRYAASRVGETAADDVMSETFLVAFEKRQAFDHSRDSAAPWLLGIATNLLHRHRRTEARLLRVAARVEEQIEVDRSDDIRDVAVALRAMRAADRDAVLLFAWADLSYDEVAAALHVPVGTVRSRLNRARRILRAATALTDEKGTSHGRTDPAARNA